MDNPFELLLERLDRQEKLLDLIVNKAEKPLPDPSTKFLTREEVAELLKINISSVFNWQKKGILTGYQMEGSSRVYYKLHEIEEALIQLK